MNTLTTAPSGVFNLAKSGQMTLDALINHAEQLKAQGQISDALNLYKIWIVCTTAANKFVAFVNWGVLLSDQGDLESAEVAYRQALKIKPDLHQAKINLGLALERKGQPQESLQLWTEVAPGLPRL